MIEKIKSEEENKDNLIFRIMPMPEHANVNGDVFGGWIMSQIDLAASVPATRVAQGRVATVAVNSIQFISPIKIGDLVSIFAYCSKTGKSSITISAIVYAERRPFNGMPIKTAEAILTFVATDNEGKSRVLPSLQMKK